MGISRLKSKKSYYQKITPLNENGNVIVSKYLTYAYDRNYNKIKLDNLKLKKSRS